MCPALATAEVLLNGVPAAQYDLMTDLVDVDMFKVYSDMLRSESLRILQVNLPKFGYLPMMSVATLGVLNTESLYERVLSCVNLVVSDLHVSQTHVLEHDKDANLLGQGDSHPCHAPDESRVHGVHEGELPGHSVVGIQSS